MAGSAKSTPVAQQLGSNQGCVAILGDLVLHSQCSWGTAWRRTAVCLVTNAETEPVYFSAVVSPPTLEASTDSPLLSPFFPLFCIIFLYFPSLLFPLLFPLLFSLPLSF